MIADLSTALEAARVVVWLFAIVGVVVVAGRLRRSQSRRDEVESAVVALERTLAATVNESRASVGLPPLAGRFEFWPTDRELDELERVARAATPGPWWSDGEVEPWWAGQQPGVAVRYAAPGRRNTHDCVAMVHDMRRAQISGSLRPLADAAHIAANNPATTLQLVGEIRRLRLEVGRK